MTEKEKEDMTTYWKARFSLGEIPVLDPAFTTEEHLRILHLRALQLEKKVRTLDSFVSCLICVLAIETIYVIWALMQIF